MRPLDVRQKSADQSAVNRNIGLSLAGLVLAAVLPLLLFGSGAAWMIVQEKRQSIEHELQSTARALQVALDRELLGQLDLMKALATDVSLDTGDLAAFEKRAQRVIAAHAVWRNVALIDPKTYFLVASALPLPKQRPTTTSPPEVDEVIRTRQPLITGVLVGQVVKEPVIQLRIPVVRADAVRYVLTVVMDPSALSELFAAQQLSPTWTGAVLDKKMVLAGRSRDAQRFVGKLATPSLANRVVASTSGMFTALNQEGNSVYTVFSRSSKTGWTIVIGVPAAEVEGPIQRVLALLGITGCVLIALTLGLAALVGRRIVRVRHDYEQALLASQSGTRDALTQFSELVARIPIGVYRYRMCADGSHRFEFVSDRFCAQIGVERDRILRDPESAFACFIAEDLPSLIQANDAARHGMHTFDWTGRVAHPDGQRWLRMESTPSLLPNGDILWNGTQQDITQQTLAAEKVEALLREQAAILNNDLVGIVTTKDRSILWANPAFEQMLGYAAGELAGVPTRQLYPSEADAQNFGAFAYPRLATGGVVRSRIEKLRKDGQTIWVDISGKMLDTTNGVAIWTFIDVTRLRFSEAELKARMDELQRFNHAMVGRELQMVALKQEVNALCQAAGESVRYVVRNVEP